MLQNSNCDKTQIVTKLKLWQNLNCDKTQIVTKHKLWQKSKGEDKKNQKLEIYQNSNCDKTQELKSWQNSKFQIVTKLKNSNCDENFKMTIQIYDFF